MGCIGMRVRCWCSSAHVIRIAVASSVSCVIGRALVLRGCTLQVSAKARQRERTVRMQRHCSVTRACVRLMNAWKLTSWIYVSKHNTAHGRQTQLQSGCSPAACVRRYTCSCKVCSKIQTPPHRAVSRNSTKPQLNMILEQPVLAGVEVLR